MTSLTRLLAIAAVSSLGFTGVALAQSNSGATSAKDAMMEKDAMKKDATMTKDEMKKDAMAPHGDIKKDDMKKDAMTKKDEMKK